MKETLGATIAETRKEKGMTQLDLAEKMGVTDKAVSKWERGLSCPDVTSLPRLAEVLELSVEELLQGKEAHRKPDPPIRALTGIALKGIGLAMGVATAVLTLLDKLDDKSAVTLLAIGLVSVALSLLRKDP